MPSRIPLEHKFSYALVELSKKYELEAIILTLSEITKEEQYGLFEHGSNMVGTEQKACGNSVYRAQQDTDFPFWNWKDKEAICRSVNFRKNVIEDTIEKFGDKVYVYQVFEKNLSLISNNE